MTARQFIAQWLLPVYVVFSFFPRLLAIPGLPIQVQLTELLFPVLLLVHGREAWRWIREYWVPAAVIGSYCLINVLAGLRAEWTFATLTEGALLEAGGRVYLGLMVPLTIAYLRQFGGDGLERTWCVATGVIALLSLLVYGLVAVGGPNLNYWVADIKVYPYFGEVLRLRGPAAVYGMYFMLLLPGLALAAYRRRWGWATVIAAACLLTLGKENLLIPTGLLLYVGWRAARGRVRRLAFSGAAVVAIVLLLATHFILIDRSDPVGETAYTNGQVWWEGTRRILVETNYAENKRAAWMIWREHPVLGVGPGQFPRWTERLVAAGQYPTNFGRFDPHSAFTGALAETGWLGLLSLLGLCFSLVRLGGGAALTAGRDRALGVLLLLFLLTAVFKDIMNFRQLWVLIGWWVFVRLRSVKSTAEGRR